MAVTHHDLVHEFPEMRDLIHELKISDKHFRKLFDTYHELTTEIEKMENEVVPVTTQAEEEKKLARIKLKDELFAMLQTAAV